MNKKALVVLLLFIILFPITLPKLVFFLLDHQQLNHTVSWTSQLHDQSIITDHPIITRVYDTFYKQSQANNSVVESYNVQTISGLNTPLRKQISEVKDQFTNEINELLSQNVFPHSLLELKQQEAFQTTFGTIDDHKALSTYNLFLVYRLEGNNDTTASFTMDRTLGVITSMNFTGKEVSKLKDADRKKLAWNMIVYLKLDDIDDWIYTENGYESYQARIQVYCMKNSAQSTNYMAVRLCPLGQYNQDSLQAFS